MRFYLLNQALVTRLAFLGESSFGCQCCRTNYPSVLEMEDGKVKLEGVPDEDRIMVDMNQ